MKKIIYLLPLLLSVVACNKDEIVPRTEELPNYYQITNDPNDPVQAKRYELYEKYNVPVFLNDTIAKVFVSISPKGDSIFRYERVDMNWEFSDNTSNKYRYDHTLFVTESDKLKALTIVEAYLKSASVPLRPFCMLLTKRTDRILLSTGDSDLRDLYEVGYRAILLQNFLNKGNTPTLLNTFIDVLKKQMVAKRLSNYVRELTQFESVSESKWYDKPFAKKVADGGLGIVWDSSRVMMVPAKTATGEDTLIGKKQQLSAGAITYRYFERDYPYETPEYIDSMRQNPRGKLGAFGFVGTKIGLLDNSYPKSEELSVFLDEILQTDRELFEKRWGNSPLVMRKYEILYGIIKEKLEVEI